MLNLFVLMHFRLIQKIKLFSKKMLPKFIALLPASKQSLNVILARNLGSSSVLLKNDPIQQLFSDKAKEYYKKKA